MKEADIKLIERAETERRYGFAVTFANGKTLYIDRTYKSEKAARNAALRARARLTSIGQKVTMVRTCCFLASVVGWCAPIPKGEFPTDFNPKDNWMREYYR